MIWQGKELRTPGDYVTALTYIARGGIGDRPIEARQFREAWEAAGHPSFERNIGYLTGYMDREHGRRIREAFDVKHPIAGDLIDEDLSFQDLLSLGMIFRQGELDGLEMEAAGERAQRAVLALREARRG